MRNTIFGLTIFLTVFSCNSSERLIEIEDYLKELLANHDLNPDLNKSLYIIIYPDGCNSCQDTVIKWINENKTLTTEKIQIIASTKYKKELARTHDKISRNINFLVDSNELGSKFSLFKFPNFLFCRNGEVFYEGELRYSNRDSLLKAAGHHLIVSN